MIINEEMKSIQSRFTTNNLITVGLFSLLMAPLFFYYWLEIVIPDYVMMMSYDVWIASLVLDMGITIQNRHLIIHHESNAIFRNLYCRCHVIVAVLIQLTVEVLFVPFLFEKTNYMIDLQASSIIAGIISVLHFVAYHSNKKTIKTIQNY